MERDPGRETAHPLAVTNQPTTALGVPRVMEPTVAERIATALRESSATHAFGLIGEGNMHLANAMTAVGIQFVASRHESAAIGMADGFARAGGSFGIATVTQGPGVTNALTSLITAARGRTPLLFFAPEIPSEVRWHIQSLNVDDLSRSLGLNCVPLDLGESAQFVRDAVSWIGRNRRPLVVRFPYTALEFPAPEDLSRSALPPDHQVERPNPDQVVKTAERLRRSQRPVFVTGAGARHASAEITALAERTGAALTTTLLAKGLFAGHTHNLGICGGFSDELTRRVVSEADCIVGFGASLNYYTNHQNRLFPEAATIIHCDADPDAIGRVTHADLRLVGDAREVASALLVELAIDAPASEDPPALRWESQGRQASSPPDGSEPDHDGVDPRLLLIRLNEILPRERVVVAEGGHHMGFVARHLEAFGDRGFMMPIDFGSIGMALGAAVGAAHAVPEKRVVLTIGDGSLLMSLGDLESLARHKVPCVVVVLDDACYGAEFHVLDREAQDVRHSVYAHQDFAAVARSLGVSALTVRSVDDLAQLPGLLDGHQGPLVVDCKIDRGVRGDWLSGH